MKLAGIVMLGNKIVSTLDELTEAPEAVAQEIVSDQYCLDIMLLLFFKIKFHIYLD